MALVLLFKTTSKAWEEPLKVLHELVMVDVVKDGVRWVGMVEILQYISSISMILITLYC